MNALKRKIWKRVMILHKCIASIANIIVDVPTVIEEDTVDFRVVTTTRS